MKQIRKILVVTMAIAIAATMMLSLKSCVFATESKTSNIIDNSINQGGQVTEIDIPNEDGTFEYSYAAEPPVQFRLSHLSRRSEPL